LRASTSVISFLIRHAVELVGHGAQALGQEADAGGVDGQLTSFGLEQRAFGSHDVAQVPVFERGVQVHAHVFAAHIELDTAAAGAEGSVLQGAEAGFAHDALEHHAACNLGGSAQGHQFFSGLFAVGFKQLGGFVFGLKVVGEGNALAIGLLLAQYLELFAALQNQLVFVLGRQCRRGRGRGRGGVRHGQCGFVGGAA
jgi:hypothetical protein